MDEIKGLRANQISTYCQESYEDKKNRILHEMDKILNIEKLPRNLFINKYLLRKRDEHGRFKKVKEA